MQQAGRVSDTTAFFYMGELIEVDKTKRFSQNRQLKVWDEVGGGWDH
jgi:phosphate transport system ATP-binding protein